MMDTEPPQIIGRNCASSTLDTLIQSLDGAKITSGIPPAQVAFGITSTLLAMIRDSMANKRDYVELGKSCAHVCQALNRGLNGRRLDQLTQSVLEAIDQLTTTVAEIRRKIIARGKRNPVSRTLRGRNDKDTIAAWGRDLDRILNIFNTELSVNNHMILLDIRRDVQAGQEGTDDQPQSPQASISLGELPPSPPRACFGRDELIKKIVGLAENLSPTALIGVGGIGKTSVALAVLHNDHIKERFGNNRRFLRCDQFSASRANFLNRLSKVIGAGVENPEDLTPLRPFLSSKEMFLVLDNAESILDPQGNDGPDIYGVVKELSQLDNLCLCITSRISTVPPDCKYLDVPTLSTDAAHSTFYRIYDNDERSGRVDEILTLLDFHPLSVTLLATVAHQNKWDNNRLVKEWERHHTGMLQTEHKESLSVTIELSLASPMFQQLGSNARGLLGVVAFFPQGINENNLDWLFPTIPDRNTIFDKFCILSLTYRSNGSITMLAPLRDHLCPKDPMASPLLCATKDLYLTRLSISVDPDDPAFKDTRWIASDDVNAERLLDVFTSADPNSNNTWKGCMAFVVHLYWHKRRYTVLGSKIEQLPDGHLWKPRGLFELSQLLNSVGSRARGKWVLSHALRLWRERGNDFWVACALHSMACVNRMLGLYEEGLQQAEEALEVFESLGRTEEQVACLINLGQLLLRAKQPDLAEEAVTHSIKLVAGGSEFLLCQSHNVLGDVFRYKRRKEKALRHYNIAIAIASRFNWHNQLFCAHYCLAMLLYGEGEFDEAQTHIKQAKQHAQNVEYYLGRAMETQARISCQQGRLEDAVTEAQSAIEIYDKCGAARDLKRSRDILHDIKRSVSLLCT